MVLLTKQDSAGVNRGFRVVNNTMYTYTQVRDAVSYFYPKRKVLEDGVSTLPLDIYVLFVYKPFRGNVYSKAGCL